jgi:glycosyltransferase involved in cell wall biosynthesis
LNILFLSELFYPNGGGAELATYLYAKLLSEAKFNVVVIANRFAGEPEFSRNEGFTVYRLPLFRRGDSVKYSVLQRVDVLFSSFMRKWMKWADIVYVPRFWFSAIPLAKTLGKPVVTHLHDYIPICPLTKFYDSSRESICSRGRFCTLNCIYYSERSADKGLFKAATSAVFNSIFGRYLGRIVSFSDGVVCASYAQRDLLTKWDKSLERKVHVIPNPLPEISQVPLEGDDFGYFGGSNIMKGFNVLCQALRLLNSDSVLVHGTNFSLMNKRMGKFLERLGVKKYPKLNHSEIDLLYRDIKAVLVPSVVAEVSPYVVTEAILHSRAIIASNIGGIPELVKGCKGVFLFNAGNPFELADKLKYVKDLDLQTIAEWGAHNIEIFEKRFSNNQTLQILIDFFHKLTS